MSHPDKQTVEARPPAPLPGRDSAPTGAPAAATAAVGGEGTPAARTLACVAGAPSPVVFSQSDVLLQIVTGLLPALVVRLVPHSGTGWFSLELNREGLFLSLRSVEVALVLPWVKF